MVSIDLTEEECYLFREFQKRHELIAYLVGYMDSMKLFDLKNVNLAIDTDKDGIIRHMSMTKHFSK